MKTLCHYRINRIQLSNDVPRFEVVLIFADGTEFAFDADAPEMAMLGAHIGMKIDEAQR